MPSDKRRHVLITCPSLTARTGLELFVSELAESLPPRGWDVTVFAPTQGAQAQIVRKLGVNVIDDIAEASRPDLIHGTFYFETIQACLRFPDVPLVFQTHAAKIWMSYPPKVPNLKRILAVDQPCADSLRAAGYTDGEIHITPNFADTSRFRKRSALPETPRKALVFSNYVARKNSFYPDLKRRCAEAGIELDIIGGCSGGFEASPETVLPDYDIVFAKARCAIEALVTGCAVITCDNPGVGQLVTTKNLEDLQRLNFGWKTLTEPHSGPHIMEQVAAYDAEDAELVCQRMRETASLISAHDLLVDHYDATLADASSAPAYTMSDLVADTKMWMRDDVEGLNRYSTFARLWPLFGQLLDSCKPG